MDPRTRREAAVRAVTDTAATLRRRRLGMGICPIAGDAYEPLLHGTVTLFVMWLLLLWMYRRKLFVKF